MEGYELSATQTATTIRGNKLSVAVRDQFYYPLR